MPAKPQYLSGLIFRTITGDHKHLEEAILEAAMRSLEMNGKYTTVSVYAKTKKAAFAYGGQEAVDRWDPTGQTPLATTQVKVPPFEYWI